MVYLKPIFLIMLFLIGVFIKPAMAIDPESEFTCKLSQHRSATITKVRDDGILELESGEQVRMIGVLPVKLFDNPSTSHSRRLNRLARQAIDLLRQHVEGKKVELRQSGRSHDRYDRLLAHVYGPDKKWLQGLLLRAGLARSFSTKDNHRCMKEMLALETTARQKRLGLWRYRTFAPQQALQQRQLLRKRYRFTLVEGRVRKVVSVKKWVFINFGENWRDDFTIAIKRKYRKNIERNGFELAKLAGRQIRVRGWIERWNGPLIKVTHQQQIELLGTSDAILDRQVGGSDLLVRRKR